MYLDYDFRNSCLHLTLIDISQSLPQIQFLSALVNFRAILHRMLLANWSWKTQLILSKFVCEKLECF